MAEGPRIGVNIDLYIAGFLRGAYQLDASVAKLYIAFDKMRPALAKYGHSISQAFEKSDIFRRMILGLGESLGLSYDQTERAVEGYTKLREEVEKTTATYRMAGAQVSRHTYQIMGLGRQVFWLALSYMFNFMAISRVQRMAWAQERAQRTIARLTRELTELNDELSEALVEYGEGSEEVTRLEERRESLVERLGEAYRRQAESQIMVVETNIMLISSFVALIYQTMLVLVTLRALQVGFLGIALSIGMLIGTFGVMGAVWLWTMRVMEDVQQQVKALREEYGLLDREVGRPSPIVGAVTRGGRVERHTHIYVHAETRKVGREIARELDRHERMGRLSVGVR